MKVEELTGHDIQDIEQALGKSFSDAAEAGDMLVGYALFWVDRRRTEPGYTWDQALGETMATVTEAVGDVNEPAPKGAAESGVASPVSVGSGA